MSNYHSRRTISSNTERVRIQEHILTKEVGYTQITRRRIHDKRNGEIKSIVSSVLIAWAGAITLFLVFLVVIIAAVIIFLALIEGKGNILIT